MLFTSPCETFLSLGVLNIKFYGLILAVAIFVGFFVIIKISRKFYPKIDVDFIYDIAPWVIISAILGARIYYVILSYDYFLLNPQEIFAIWHGGISIHGAIIGGLVCGAILAKKKNKPLLGYLDVFSYGLVLGQAIGRWGNFFNSEAFGFPCNLPWKLFIPIAKRPIEFATYQFFHPTFLYESLLDIFIFLLLFFVLRKFFYKKTGAIFFSYLILYSFVRIFVESFRIDSVLNVASIPIASLVSVLFAIIGVCGLIFVMKNQN